MCTPELNTGTLSHFVQTWYLHTQALAVAREQLPQRGVMHPERRDNEPQRRLGEALMNRLCVKSTLETDEIKLRMLNFDLMMQCQGAHRGGWQVWGYNSKCCRTDGCDTCMYTWKSRKVHTEVSATQSDTLMASGKHTQPGIILDTGITDAYTSPSTPPAKKEEIKKTCKNTSMLWQQTSLLCAPLFLILHVISCLSSSRRGMRISVRNIPAEEPDVTATKDGPPLCSK